MKTTILFIFILALAIGPSALSQDKDTSSADAGSMAPPKPLDDAMTTWMVGNWSGTSESNMGTAKESEKCEMSLDKQFVVMHLTSRFTKVNPDRLKSMAAQMKVSEKDAAKIMKNMTYKGIGMLTADPKTGDYVGYWFDSWRGMYKGVGKVDGNKITMNWDGAMGSSVRTIEKDDEGNLVQSYKEKDMTGNVVEGKSVYSLKKK